MIKTTIRGKKIRVGDVPALIFLGESTWSIYLSSTLPGQVPEVVRVLPLLLSSALIRSTIADSVVFVNDADGPLHFQYPFELSNEEPLQNF